MTNVDTTKALRTNTNGNFSGFLMDACTFRVAGFPSKFKIAIPKNMG
jgi:hypothetical protein